jgi:tripartite-type tricarboxylate transporter receptor subunit TctC
MKTFLRAQSGRCTLLRLLFAVGASMLLSAAAFAQAPLRIVVPVPPGGGLDTSARLIATHMMASTGQAVVVENRPGGDAQIGIQYVVKAPPDGRTVLFAASFLATNVVLHRFNFDPTTELVPVIMTTANETVLAVNATLDVKTLQDLVALAQRRPEGLNCGAAPGHPSLACEQFRPLLGGKATTIPYAGLGPAVNSLAAGHVDFMVAPKVALNALHEAGKVRFIAGADDRRLAPPLDHLPLVRETWPSVITPNFNGIFVPVGTPPDVVLSLNQDFNRVLALPEVRSALGKAGNHVTGGPPEVLAKTLANGILHVRKLANDLQIRPN